MMREMQNILLLNMTFLEKRNTMSEMIISLYDFNSTFDNCRRKDKFLWRYRMTNYPKCSKETEREERWIKKEKNNIVNPCKIFKDNNKYTIFFMN